MNISGQHDRICVHCRNLAWPEFQVKIAEDVQTHGHIGGEIVLDREAKTRSGVFGSGSVRFLGRNRIAIWGVEDARSDPGQWVAGKFQKRGAQVITVNPKFSDDAPRQRASSLTRIDPPVEAVLVYVDRPQTMQAVNDCLAARVPLVWLHDALSPGAAIPEAIDKLRAAGCRVIPGLCPMFYLKPLDPAHLCLKWVLRLTGKERRIRRSLTVSDHPPS